MRTHPFIDVTVNGAPVSGVFYQRLTEAKIHDAPGQDADTVELTFDDKNNEITIPAKGAILVVKFGYRDVNSCKMGRFTYERWNAKGDSMETTIFDGDPMIIDVSVREPVDEGVYVLIINGLVRLKRIQMLRSGVLVLKSDNPRYDAEEVPQSELPDLIVGGRVRWVGRRI